MNVLNDFGFCNSNSFVESLLATQYKYLLIAFSGITSVGQFFFGMLDITMFLLFILMLIELVTGIWASKIRKRKISSKRLQRFGLKFMIYFFFIMLFQRLKEEPALHSTKELYEYMYSFFIMYFVGVHLKSIAENYSRISGKPSDLGGFIKKINEKFFKNKT